MVFNELRIPEQIYNDFHFLKGRQKEICCKLASLLYYNAFSSCIVSTDYLSQAGFGNDYISTAKKILYEMNYFDYEYRGNSYTKLADRIKIKYVAVKNIYAKSTFFFTNYDEALSNLRFIKKRNRIPNAIISKYLSSSNFDWNSNNALELLNTAIDFKIQQKYWKLIRFIKDGKNKCFFRQNKKDGRIYSHNNNIQGIPRIFRRNGIIYAQNTLYDIDYSSQFINVLLCLNGKDPIDDFWNYINSKLNNEFSKEEIKGIVNPKIFGQKYSNFLWNEYQEQGFQINIVRTKEKYSKIITTLEEIGIDFSRTRELFNTTSEIFQLILKKMATNKFKLVLPIHDGVIIDGQENDAEIVSNIFRIASKEILGKALPIKQSPLPNYKLRSVA